MIACGQRSAGMWLGAFHRPPGRSVPGNSWTDVSLGSIHATKMVNDVCLLSGRTLVVYTPGRPRVSGPVGTHTPSPSAMGSTGPIMRAGGARWGIVVVVERASVVVGATV